MENPYTTEQWLNIFKPLMDVSENQYIYVQITRGVAPKRDHAFPENTPPTIFAMCNNIVPFAGLETGVKAITLDDSRWQFCNIKAIALLAHLLHRQDAVEKDCAEAILINRDGFVTEGAASNLFAVIDGVLLTPPKSNQILAGITRDVILELAAKNNIACRETDISLAELKTATEIWVTSSTREIIPVVELDGVAVADGKVGAVWHTMNSIFQAYKHSLL
jgi:D-alanine transaminase